MPSGLTTDAWNKADRRTYRLNLTSAGKKTLASMIRCDRKRVLDALKRIAAQAE